MTAMKEFSKCPWFGPMPCNEIDANRFHGRTDEIFNLLQKVRTQDVTILTADSGAGKSSLINAGLIPALRLSRDEHPSEIGFALCIRTWGRVASPAVGEGEASIVSPDPAVFLMYNAFETAMDELEESAAKYRSRILGYSHLKSDVEIIKIFRENYKNLKIIPGNIQELCLYVERLRNLILGNKLVLVVDQAEEYMGSSLNSTNMHIKAMSVLGALSRIPGVRLVISLRDEYLGKLRSLEQWVPALAPRTIYLNPLSWKGARDVIIRAADGHGLVVEEDAINALISLTLPESDRNLVDEDHLPVDMLGIQACLVDIYRSVKRLKIALNLSYIEKYTTNLIRFSGSIFVEPLLRWVSRSFKYMKATEDKYLILRVAANMGPALSTPKGYKSHISKRALIYTAIKEDVKLFLRDNKKYDSFRKDITSSVRFNPEDHGKQVGRLYEAGEIAVNRLIGRFILKKGGVDNLGDLILSLQHDGYGQAFNAWCDDVTLRENDCLVSGIATMGAEVTRKKSIKLQDLYDVMWQSCFVNKVRFSGVTFRDCNFDGTYFGGCDFSKCVFINCTLKASYFKEGKFSDVVFKYCDLRGIVFDSMHWDTVSFVSGCDVSSGVVRGVLLSNNLEISNSTFLYAQVYSFTPEGATFKISIAKNNMWGGLFEDYYSSLVDRTDNIVSNTIEKGPASRLL